MRFEELERTCQEAAVALLDREGRPLPAAVVLPGSQATRVVELPEFPQQDGERFALLGALAEDEMRPAGVPCWGFVAEAIAEADGAPVDVVVVVCGARGHHPRIAAGVLDDDGVGPFEASEELAPTAMRFLAPLQHAADAAEPPDVMER